MNIEELKLEIHECIKRRSFDRLAYLILDLLDEFEYDWSKGVLPCAEIFDAFGVEWFNITALNTKTGIAMSSTMQLIQITPPITIKWYKYEC